jgi:hypothetical protein
MHEQEGLVGTRDRAVRFANVPKVSEETLSRMMTNVGISVAELSLNHRVFVVFLTRIDCPHCQFNLNEFVSEQRTMLQLNTFFVLVHQETDEVIMKYFGADSPVPKFQQNSNQLARVIRVSDPELAFYEAFEVKKAHHLKQWALNHPLKTKERINEGYSKESSGYDSDKGFQRQIYVISKVKITAHWEYHIFENVYVKLLHKFLTN